MQTWNDTRLRFNSSLGVEEPLSLYGSDALSTIWAPDTTFTTAREMKFHKAEGLWDNDVFNIYRDGSVRRISRYSNFINLKDSTIEVLLN